MELFEDTSLTAGLWGSGQVYKSYRRDKILLCNQSLFSGLDSLTLSLSVSPVLAHGGRTLHLEALPNYNTKKKWSCRELRVRYWISDVVASLLEGGEVDANEVQD